MSGRRRLIVVSNRGPVTYRRDESGRVARRGGGGLVTALAPLVSLHEVTWIANALSDEDRAVAEEAGGSFEETGRGGERYRMLYEGQDGRSGRLAVIRSQVNKRGTALAPRRRVVVRRGVSPRSAWVD